MGKMTMASAVNAGLKSMQKCHGGGPRHVNVNFINRNFDLFTIT